MNFLLLPTLLAATLDWYAVHKGWKKLEYFLKPITMVFLFGWLFTSTGFTGIALWFGVGILLSMAGDIFLMLPQDKFIAGLVAFLLAHIAYIIGFTPNMPRITLPSILAIIVVAVIGWQLYVHISAGLKAQGKEKLQKPVLAYTIVIAIMQITALLTLFRPEWTKNAALTVSLGAALFMLSDAILAWNKFVKPIKNGRTINMAAYHLGQIILMLGVWMQVL